MPENQPNPTNPNQPVGQPIAQPAPVQQVPVQPVQQMPVQQVPQMQVQQPQPVQPIQAVPKVVPVQPVQQIVQPAPVQQVPVQPVQQMPVQQVPQMQAQPAPMQQPVAPMPTQTPTRPVQGMVQQPARPGMPQQPLRPGMQRPGVVRKPPNPKKLLFGCLGCSGIALLFFIIFVLVFVSQTTASGENPLARSLGVDTGSFINTLILLVNLIFGVISVGLFMVMIIGFFRLFMARKDDKEAKKRGVTQAGVSGLLLLVFAIMWVGIYLFLSAKKVPVQKANTSIGIITDPASTLQLTAPITVKFDGSQLPINTKTYDILSYSWSFGDGQTSTVPVTTHTYSDKGSNNGRFDVNLEVTKRDKKTKEETSDTYTTIVTIANVKINPVINATPESGPGPLSVNFDASASTAPAGDIVSYEWDFDNNNIFTDATGSTVSHTFEQQGTYKVNLRVTDNTGQFEVGSKDINVTPPNVPVAMIDIPTTNGKYFTGNQYTFLGEKSTSPNGEIKKYEWDFGDGSSKANTRTANHVFKSAGTYEVHLTVTDETGVTGEGTNTIKVEVAESAPIASIKTSPATGKDESLIAGTMPFEVVFDATGSKDPDNNIVDYKWDFNGDGTSDDTGEKATYVYKEPGTYNATLTVVDAENNEGNAVIVVKVGSQPLQARITAEPVEGVVPLTVVFDASSSSYPNGQIVSYEWDFGDGTPKRIDVSKVTYKYTKIGTFTASVAAIASDNTRSTAQTPVNVRPVPLTSCYEASTETGAAPLTVEFDPRCSTGTVAKYSWDFGDGETSKTRKPTHTFNKPGSYEVTLEVSDAQNVLDTFTKSILVTGAI
jgi:PKD repeat protein